MFHKFFAIFFAFSCMKIVLPAGSPMESSSSPSSPSSPRGHHHRQERTLIYPPTAPTRIQWIIGIGIPLEDLLYEAMTTGYVLKAEYFLPETVDQLRIRSSYNIKGRDGIVNSDGIGGIGGIGGGGALFEKFLVDEHELNITTKFDKLLQNNKNVLSNYRWSLYQALEGLGDRIGLNGRSCILKSICQAAEIPFHYNNGLLGELIHIILTPSSSADILSDYTDNEYFHAEALGRSGAQCDHVFKDCMESLLERFSDVHTLMGEATKMMD